MTASAVLEDIAVQQNLKVKFLAFDAHGAQSRKSDGKEVTYTKGAITPPSKYNQIRAAVRKIEEVVTPVAEEIGDNWTETHKTYRKILESEKTPEKIVKSVVKSLVKKYDHKRPILRLIGETIVNYCDKADMADKADNVQKAA